MSGVLAAAVRAQVEDLPGRVAFETTDDFAGFLNRVLYHRKMQLGTAFTPGRGRRARSETAGRLLL